MEVHYRNGHVEMEQFDSMADAQRAMMERLEREDVLRATIHKEGSEIVQRGKRYRLNALGQWVRVGKKRPERGEVPTTTTTAASEVRG